MNQDWLEIFNSVLQNNEFISIEKSLENVNKSYLNWLNITPLDNNPNSSNYYKTIHNIIVDSLIYKRNISIENIILIKAKKAELLMGINIHTLEKSNDIKILEFFSNNKINFLYQVIMESNNLINTVSNITIDIREDCLNIFTQKCTNFLELDRWGNVINPHICSNLQINNITRFDLLYDEYIKMKLINPNINFSKLIDFYLLEWHTNWLGKETIKSSEIATLSKVIEQYELRINSIEIDLEPPKKSLITKDFSNILEEDRNIVNFNSYMNILDSSREREVDFFVKKK